MHTDEVDKLLTMSDPASELTLGEQQLSAEMIDQSMPAKRLRRYARPIAAGAIAAVLLGGGGVAAAAVTGLWDPWAEKDALAILHYELPSGASCDMRVGNVQGAPDEVDDVIRDAMDGVVIDDADVVEGATYGGNIGDPLTDDEAYQTGFNWAIIRHLEAALAAHDLESEFPQFSAQGVCE